MTARYLSLADAIASGVTVDPGAIALAEAPHQLQALPPSRLARQATIYRQEAEHVARYGYPEPLGTVRMDLRDGWTEARCFEYGQHMSWLADLYDDPTLLGGFLRMLPPDVAAEAAANIQNARSPFPLVVDVPPGWWSCDSCGAAFEEGEAEAVIIGTREGWSDLAEPIAYCGSCIAAAAEAIGAILE